MSHTSINYEFDFEGKLPVSAQIGMAQCDAHAKAEWKRYVDGCIQRAALRLPEFTVDDVLDALDALPFSPSTHNLAALGPRMKEVSKTLKYMKPSDRVQRSRRPASHGNFLRVWLSQLYEANR